MGMEHWWDSNDEGILKYCDRNLHQCYYIRLVSPAEWLETEAITLRGQDSDWGSRTMARPEV